MLRLDKISTGLFLAVFCYKKKKSEEAVNTDEYWELGCPEMGMLSSLISQIF